jgi:hypothetical protein
LTTQAVSFIRQNFGSLKAFQAAGGVRTTVPLARLMIGRSVEIVGTNSANPLGSAASAIQFLVPPDNLAQAALKRKIFLFAEGVDCDREQERIFIETFVRAHQNPGLFFGLESPFQGLFCRLVSDYRILSQPESQRQSKQIVAAKFNFIYRLKTNEALKQILDLIGNPVNASLLARAHPLAKDISDFLRKESGATPKPTLVVPEALFFERDYAWQALLKASIQEMEAFDEVNQAVRTKARAVLERPENQKTYDAFFKTAVINWRHPVVVRNIVDVLRMNWQEKAPEAVVLVASGEENSLRYKLLSKLLSNWFVQWRRGPFSQPKPAV